MLTLKMLGAIDVITAIALHFNLNMWYFTIPLFLIHILKGIASMTWDWVGKLYGAVDIVSAFAMLFIFTIPLGIEYFLIAILLFKGVMSWL